MSLIPMFRPPSMDKDLALRMIGDAIDRGYIGEGPYCKAFEEKLSHALGFPAPLYMNSGTSALRLAFHLAGARPGREVICTPMTCLATATAILETGASVVWADIDKTTGNIDPASVAEMMSAKTVAIAAVDWGGRLCDFRALRDVASGVSIVEDAAHAFGVKGQDRGDFVCYSLQAIKHVTTADGGVLVCPGSALTERARLLRWFGLDRSRGASMRCLQTVPEAGFKMQGNDILAALGIASLVGSEDRLEAHRNNAKFYTEQLSGLPYVYSGGTASESAFWFYPLLVSSPRLFTRFMAAHGVETGQVHARIDTQPCFDSARSPREMPGVDSFSAHQVNIPCGSHIRPQEREIVVRAISRWNAQPEARW